MKQYALEHKAMIFFLNKMNKLCILTHMEAWQRGCESSVSSNLTASAKFEKPLLKTGAFFISIILPLILPHIKIWIELDRF
ncbi:hypothetical protein CA950_12170 [Acinetobacter pittii]|nr:hypothetical protein CA950_12170 [Acinetobacter pittii]